MSKVKKNIRLCAISTDFSELGGYTAQFTDQEEAKDALEPPEGGDCLHNGSISMPSARGMPQRVFTA